METAKSDSAFERASKALVGGVNSPVRAFAAVGGSPCVIARGAGSRVTDLDGKPLDFSTGARLTANNGVLATNGPVHDLILAAVRSAG